MVERTQLEQVVDGDYLSQGYLNEIGTFYVEHTDTAGNQTHNAATWSKVQTFTFSGLSTNYVLKAVELEDISLSDSGANSNDWSRMGMIITDGTTHWSPKVQRAVHRPNNVSNAIKISEPLSWHEVSSGSPVSGVINCQTGAQEFDYTSIPVPYNTITGATSYNVEIYLYATQNFSNTVTLNGSYKIRLIFEKRIQNLGTSTSQA